MAFIWIFKSTRVVRKVKSPLGFPPTYPHHSVLSAIIDLFRQPFAMDLPLAATARCDLRSVFYVFCSRGTTPIEMHLALCEGHGQQQCMDIKHLRNWCRVFKNWRIDIHDEQRAGRPTVSDKTIAKVVRANVSRSQQRPSLSARRGGTRV